MPRSPNEEATAAPSFCWQTNGPGRRRKMSACPAHRCQRRLRGRHPAASPGRRNHVVSSAGGCREAIFASTCSCVNQPSRVYATGMPFTVVT